MSNIHFETTFDNSKLIRGISQANITVGQFVRNVETQGTGVEQAFNRMTNAAGAYLSLRFASQIGREIINVRGEFQQLGIAFETMLGSKEKADALMNQAVAFAAKTPFTLTDVATNIKQLMAMGIENEKVMETMKSLGDVAAGVSVPISRIAINYGQVATQGKLMGRELRDFNMAGIPLAQELAKNLGVAKDEISGMVEAGKIGFPEVERAFQTMSGEGGKFYNLMEKQNASVTGQMSNFTDKLQVAANEIGKANEGIIYGSISLATSTIKNYKEIGEAITELAVAYGVYKTATIVVMAIESARIAVTEAKKASFIEELELSEASTLATTRKAEKEAIAATLAIEIEAKKQAAALKTVAAMEASEIANAQLVAAEERLAAVKGKQIIVTNEVAAVETARANLNKAIALENKALTQETILNEKLERDVIIKANADKMLSDEAALKLKNEEIIKNTVATGAEIRAAQAKKLSAAAQSLLNATMLNNPYVAGAVALGALTYGLYKYITYQTELEKSTSKMNVELENEKDKVNDLFSALKLTTEGTKEHTAAKKKLIDTYGQYIPEQNKELNNLIDIKNAYDAVNQSLAENIAIKTKEEFKAKISEEFNPKAIKGRNNILDQLSGQAKSDVAFELNALIEKFKLNGTSADKIQEEWKAFYQKLTTIDKTATEGLSARKIQGYFFDMLMPIAEMNKGFKEADDSFNKFISDSKKGQPEPPSPEYITAEQQRVDLREKLVSLNKELVDLEKKKFEVGKDKMPLDAIAEKKAEIKAIEDKLGLHEKEKKEIDKLKVANEALEKAVKSGNKEAIEAAAQEVDALEKKKMKIQEIIDLELQRSWRNQFDGKAMSPITPIALGSSTGISKVGQTRMFGGVMQELVEIDKKGNQIWKNRKLEAGDLAKFAKEKYKDGIDEQEDLDKKLFNKKKQFQEDLINYSRQFTSELIEQLGLTEEESKQLNGMADIISNLASGNFLAAGFSGASFLLSALTNKKEDPTTKALENVNDLLEKQSAILSNLAGSNYFELAQKQYDDYGKAIDLNNKKLQDSRIFTKKEWKDLQDEFKQWQQDFPNPQIKFSTWVENKWSETNNWTPQDFIDAYVNGSIALDQQQIDWVTEITEKQKQRSELLQETFRAALGFDSSDVSDSIFNGIDEGLRLGENSLGGFAQSFGDLMKKALMQAIVDSTNSDITSNFLPKVKEFLENDEIGPDGAKISPREHAILESIYSSIVKRAEETKSVTDKYGNPNAASSTPMSGIQASASEETVGAMVGQAMALRNDVSGMKIDVKSLLEVGMNQLDIMTIGVQHLSKIEKNTGELLKMDNLINAIIDMHSTIKKNW